MTIILLPEQAQRLRRERSQGWAAVVGFALLFTVAVGLAFGWSQREQARDEAAALARAESVWCGR